MDSGTLLKSKLACQESVEHLEGNKNKNGSLARDYETIVANNSSQVIVMPQVHLQV